MVRICAFPAGFAAAAVMMVLGFGATPAAAQGYFPWSDNNQPRTEPARDWARRPQPHYGTKRKAVGWKTKGALSAPKAERAGVNVLERPLFAVISIADQHVSIYNNQGLVARSAVSTGKAGHPTPKGVFTIIGRERFHESNIYSGAPMPFMQRITWSGVAMHLGVVPGHPASHGCIRLPAAFAVKLWGLTRIGERVVISPQEVTPVEFAHPLLPAPKMLVQAEADKPAPAPGAAPAPVGAAPPPLLNPRQYAEQLKVKAEAEVATTLKTLKETSAVIVAKQREAAGAAAELRAAEAANALAQAKADAATKAYEAAAAAASAKQQEAAGAATELSAAEAAKTSAQAKADDDAKTSEAAAAASSARQQEAAGAAAELSAAEAAKALAQAKADAATKTYEAAAAAASARREEAAGAAAELKASESRAPNKAKADRLAKAYEGATAAREAAATTKSNAGAALAEAALRLETAKTASSAKAVELADAARRSVEAKTAYDAAANAQKEALRRMSPLSVLVSKKDRRIYVRQGLAPLFDAPASVRDPEMPLGSHLFIATAAKDDGASLNWSVLTMPTSVADEGNERRRKTASIEEKFGPLLRSHGSVSSPAEALERVEIAPDVRDRIAERLWTGGSLIISDQPLSNETGNVGTDLTVKFR